MKKVFAILIAAMLCITAAAMAQDTYTVGVSQLVQHVALDAATQGFVDALTEKLGDSVKIDVQNASGDSNTCSTIVNTFIEAHDLSGKVLNVFATSGGSDVKGSANDLKNAYPQYTWSESQLMN